MGDGVTTFFHDTSKGLRTKGKWHFLVFQLMFMHMNQLPLSVLFCGSSIGQEALLAPESLPCLRDTQAASRPQSGLNLPPGVPDFFSHPAS